MKRNKPLSGLTASLLRSISPIFSLFLTLLGGTLFLTGCGANGFDWNVLSNVQIQQMEYVESAGKNITDIDLNFDTADFNIDFDENAEGISISYPQRQNKKGKNISEITVIETENSLTIAEKQESYFAFFDFNNPLVTVTIPSARVCALSIEGDTGDVVLNDGGVFSSLSVKVSTGDIHLSNIQAEKLEATLSTGNLTINGASVTGTMSTKASTGDISLSQVTANTLTANASTGNIRISDTALVEALNITTSTGNQTLSMVMANSIAMKASSGKVKLSNLTVTESLTVQTSTGDIILNENITANTLTITADTGDVKATDALIDSMNISITTDTGYVKATLVATKHDYATSVTTDTGSKNISSNLENIIDGLINPDRKLKIKTDTGDIKIYFNDAN